MNQEEANQKILKIINKENDLSKKEFQLFKELMFRCDLNQKDKRGWTPLMYALIYNESQNLNLNQEQFDYLLQNSELTHQDKDGWTTLMIAFACNKIEGLNLSEKQINYLIQHSNLKQQDKDGWTPFLYALYYNKEQDLKMTIKQFKTMYKILDEEKQQTTFQKLIQEYVENNHQYLEEMNILLYEFEFQPNKKTLIWLQKNNFQDIIQMIEKRNFLFQLNQEIKSINNHKKIDNLKKDNKIKL